MLPSLCQHTLPWCLVFQGSPGRVLEYVQMKCFSTSSIVVGFRFSRSLGYNLCAVSLNMMEYNPLMFTRLTADFTEPNQGSPMTTLPIQTSVLLIVGKQLMVTPSSFSFCIYFLVTYLLYLFNFMKMDDFFQGKKIIIFVFLYILSCIYHIFLHKVQGEQRFRVPVTCVFEFIDNGAVS